MRLRFWARTDGCYHEEAFGIYGDEVLFGTPKSSRGYCPTCKTYFTTLPPQFVIKKFNDIAGSETIKNLRRVARVLNHLNSNSTIREPDANAVMNLVDVWIMTLEKAGERE